MKYGCIGERLRHSFSKEIHNSLADYEYELKEIPKDKLEEFMTNRDFRAINVTIPYKEAVIPYLYYIDDAAKKIRICIQYTNPMEAFNFIECLQKIRQTALAI